MKTVQEALRIRKKKDVIACFLAAHQASLSDLPKKTVTGQFFKREKKALAETYKRFEHMKLKYPKKDKNRGIFYISRSLTDDYPAISYNLTFVKDLKEKGIKAESYAYEFNRQKEILAWRIADNPLTQHFIDYLLADIIYEATWFGDKQEDLKQEKKKLDKSVKEAKTGKGKLIPADNLFNSYDMDTIEMSDKEKELEAKAIRAESDFMGYSQEKELKMIMEELGIKEPWRKSKKR